LRAEPQSKPTLLPPQQGLSAHERKGRATVNPRPLPGAFVTLVHRPGCGLGLDRFHHARSEGIEEEPTSLEATWSFSPLLAVAFAVGMPSLRRFRRCRKLRNAEESGSPEVPVAAVSSESESPRPDHQDQQGDTTST